MEFTALFLAVSIAMRVAWRGPRSLALALFTAVMLACVATYLHHATDALKLSFRAFALVSLLRFCGAANVRGLPDVTWAGTCHG